MEIKRESFWKKYRDKIIVGVLIAVIGSIVYASISGIGTTIYSWFPGNWKTKIPQSYTPSYESYELANFSTTIIDALLDKVRNEHKVRQLLPLESGKKLADIPELTYSFLFPAYLRVLPSENFSVILRGTADRFNVYRNYFEMHKIKNDEIYLLGFVSEEAYVNMSSRNINTITLFPYPDVGRNYLLVIPIKEIKESDDREIAFNERNRINVLDLSFNPVK